MRIVLATWSAREIAEWEAYEMLEPPIETILAYEFGALRALIMNALGDGKTKHTVQDAMLMWGKDSTPEESPEEIADRIAEGFKATLNKVAG